MTVSIIIPCFNGQRTIALTMQSALNQTYGHCEIIVINDGSTDQSRQIIERYNDRLIAIHTENQGVSAARNLGTERASGEWLIYLDADDLLTRDAITSRLDCSSRSNAEIVYSDWQRFQYDSEMIQIPGKVESTRIGDVHSDPEIACATSFWSPPAALMYHRNVIEKIGGWSEALPVIQDARFLFDAACTGAEFSHLQKITAMYLDDDPNSLSRQNSGRFIQDVMTNAIEIQERWLSRDVRSGTLLQYQSALSSIYDYVARESMRVKEIELYLQSVKRIDDLIGLSAASRWVRLSDRMQRWLGFQQARSLLRLIGK